MMLSYARDARMCHGGWRTPPQGGSAHIIGVRAAGAMGTVPAVHTGGGSHPRVTGTCFPSESLVQTFRPHALL